MNKTNLRLSIVTATICTGLVSAAFADNWLVPGGGSWSVGTNWSSNSVPNAPDAIAVINTDITANATGASAITLDAPITVAALSIGDSATAGGYSLWEIAAGTGGSLTFQASTGTAVLSRAPGGSTATDTLTTNVTLNSNLDAIVNTGMIQVGVNNVGSVGLVSGAGGVVRKVSTAGASTGIFALENVNNTYTGTTSVQDGILQFRGSVLSGQNSALGNSSSPIAIGTAASSTTAATPTELRLAASDDTSDYTIDRGLDFSAALTGGTNTSNLIFRFTANGAGLPNTNKLTLAGPITFGSVVSGGSISRNAQFIANRAGMTIDFTGLITGYAAGAARNILIGGNPTATTATDGVGGPATYRFANVNNSFGGNLNLQSGTVIIVDDVGALGTNSAIGVGGSGNVGLVLNDGNGNNIVGGFNGSTAAVTSVRSIFMETGGTTFARNLVPAGGVNSNVPVYNGGTARTVGVINGYRIGQALTGATNVASEITWSGNISAGTQNVGVTNDPAFAGPNKMVIPGNIALFAADGGTVNFTGQISEQTGGVVSSGGSQGSSSFSRVTINQFRNNRYLDGNQDGIPDSGLAAGLNADDWISTPTTGTVKLSSNTNSWEGTTDVRGGKLIVNGNLGTGVTAADTFKGDTVTVYAGATIGGVGNINAGKLNSSLQVLSGATLAPGDAGVGGMLIRKPLNLAQGSTFAVELAGAADGQFDRVTVSAPSATIAGSINLSLLGGYDPEYLANHDIVISSNPVTGIFNQVTGLSISSNKALAVTYAGTRVRVTAAKPGDHNLSGFVDFDDLLVLAQQYGTSSGAQWSTGDFSGDGAVTFDDLLALAQNYAPGALTDATAIASANSSFHGDWAMALALAPEPASALGLLSCGLLARRRRASR